MPEKKIPSATLTIKDANDMTAAEKAALLAWLQAAIDFVNAGSLPAVVIRRFDGPTG